MGRCSFRRGKHGGVLSATTKAITNLVTTHMDVFLLLLLLLLLLLWYLSSHTIHSLATVRLHPYHGRYYVSCSVQQPYRRHTQRPRNCSVAPVMSWSLRETLMFSILGSVLAFSRLVSWAVSVMLFVYPLSLSLLGGVCPRLLAIVLTQQLDSTHESPFLTGSACFLPTTSPSLFLVTYTMYRA